MSEPTRYTLTMESCEAGEVHYMHIKGKAESAPFGDYVLFEDYARLKADVERLTEIIRREVDRGVDLREEAQRTVEENHKLRAEVERLIKELENTDCMFAMASAFARDWTAAKEGKQP